jgi:D-alanyl-D-alanine carboxypeptidase
MKSNPWEGGRTVVVRPYWIRLAMACGAVSCACAPMARAQVESQTPDVRAAVLRRLLKAYPTQLDRIDGNELVWMDGTRMAIDDGLGVKPHEVLLATADVKDMLVMPYVVGEPAKSPSVNADPGRARNGAFFNKMYGDCTSNGVVAKLVDVVWLPKKSGKTVKFSAVNGAAEKLGAVSRELDALPAAFDRFLFPSAGTYVCRPIAGTTRVSAHGHGIAIDIATAFTDYWLLAGGKAGSAIPYRNRLPMEIVAIFEKHGFIWGGRWYHYDTMHFEYRPELIGE